MWNDLAPKIRAGLLALRIFLVALVIALVLLCSCFGVHLALKVRDRGNVEDPEERDLEQEDCKEADANEDEDFNC